MAKAFRDVAIAIVWNAGELLVGVRPPGATLAGLHEFPGGKCQPGETPADAARRECLEETGLAVRVDALRCERRQSYPHGDVHLYFFDCAAENQGPPQNGFRWLPLAEVLELPFPPGNDEVLDDLRQRPQTLSEALDS